MIPSYVENYAIFNKMLAILISLLKLSSLDQKIVNKALNKITVEYYSEKKVESKNLFAVISVLKVPIGLYLGIL